jgi:hypothetical protein
MVMHSILKQIVVSMLLLAMSLPAFSDPEPQCPCFRAEQVAGTCLRYLKLWDNSVTYNYGRNGASVKCIGKFETWTFGTTYEGFSCHTTRKRNGTPNDPASGQEEHSREEIDACMLELADAADLLGLSP